jgi:hypothetical protein
LLHNALQTALYDKLAALHGPTSVGTEVPTGYGTSIDLVLKVSGSCAFYEIKVAPTIKASIRQAIPQLLEYAYWRKDSKVADKLVIASKFKVTKEATDFIKLLRHRFALPPYYEQILP